jgi:hypothetical protein
MAEAILVSKPAPIQIGGPEEGFIEVDETGEIIPESVEGEAGATAPPKKKAAKKKAVVKKKAAKKKAAKAAADEEPAAEPAKADAAEEQPAEGESKE